MTVLRKGGSNWVDGDRFYNRKIELEALEERVRDGIHTLLTAQRRMGKTSLVRELLRRLDKTGEFETVFVDLEGCAVPADAIAEIAAQAKHSRAAWDRIKDVFANFLGDASEHFEEAEFGQIRLKLRAGTTVGNWQDKGDAVFSALASSDRPVVLALDELPILVNRMLKEDKEVVTPQGRQAADKFLSWLRRMGQDHREKVSMILSGSVGLEPILEQARLSAHANIFAAYDLNPWSRETAAACLAALAETYEVQLAPEVREDMCQRLRCCIPHHVQMFFDKLQDYLRKADRRDATLDDAERVYLDEMLSVRGQVDLQHYEGRLQNVLGRTGYPIALELLTAAAVEHSLTDEAVDRYTVHFAGQDGDNLPTVSNVLRVLEHDGYLERVAGGYRMVSGLLEDWWRSRYGGSFKSVIAAAQ